MRGTMSLASRRTTNLFWQSRVPSGWVVSTTTTRTTPWMEGNTMRFYSTFRTNEEGLRLFTRSEVAAHNTDEDLWVIIDGRVYDLSMWINFHPGGRDPLIEMAGKDATELFNEIGHSLEARQRMKDFELGVVETPLRYHGSEYADRAGEV